MLYEEFINKFPDFVGTKRFCNICGYRFSKFRNFNKLHPREAQCPMCGSLERHRHIYIYLNALTPFLKNKKILHFAPERIIKIFFENSEAEYYDADLDSKKATYTQDITNITFSDDYFDYIVCIHVLEHIVDDIKAMKELYRVLAPEGTAFLAVPYRAKAYEDYSITDPKEREIHFGQDDHVRFYSLDLFCERLKKVGFQIDLVSPDKFPKNFREETLLGQIFIFAHKK